MSGGKTSRSGAGNGAAGAAASRIRRLLEMIRFSHTLFALPFAMWAAVMAWRFPLDGGAITFRLRDLLGLLICLVAARTAAMTFNRIVDCDIDAENPRTAQRHLPTGQITLWAAWWFLAGGAAAFVAGTALFLPNRLPLLLALPVLAYLLAYSHCKRFTWLSHFWLGGALALAPIATWIALRGAMVQERPSDLAPALWLGGGVLFWVAGFDILYACQDAEFDRRRGLFSIPARFGIARALRVARGVHALAWACWLGLWISHRGAGPDGFGGLLAAGLLAAGALMAASHRMVAAADLSRVNVAFFHVNAVISLGLFLVGTLDLAVI